MTKLQTRNSVRVLCALGLSFVLAACALASGDSAAKSASLEQFKKLVDRGELDLAERQLWDIVTREPENAPAINLLGTIRVKQKRFPEAEALFKRVVAITPGFAEAYRNLGELYSALGRNDDAKAAYLKAHELAPKDIHIALALGTIYKSAGEFERSLELVDTIPAGIRPPAALPVLASDYFGIKQPNKVEPLVPLALKAAAFDPTVVPRFARVLVENGFVDDADHLLKASAPREKETPEYLLVLARVQEQQGDVAKAERTLTRAATLDPKSFDALFQLARLASKGQQWKKEGDLLEKALELQPENLDALRHLISARMRSDQGASAVAAARQLYALRPDDPDVVHLLGATLANHAEWHAARPIMEKLLSLRDDATSHVMLGMTLMNDGDIEGASQQIERALQQNPSETEARYYKGVIARQRGDLTEAINELQEVVRANPQHALAQSELGTLALQLGNLDLARQALEKAVALRPDIPENHYQMALVYSRVGLADKARAEMQEFQKLKDASSHKPKGPTGN